MPHHIEESAMDAASFAALLRRFTAAVEAGDGAAFGQCFTADALYHDYIYGAHRGRPAIARMLEELFHRDARGYRWEMLEPVVTGDTGYARWLFSYTSAMPEFAGRRVVIEGMSQFLLRDAAIAAYREAVNGGVAMIQLGVDAARIEKRLKRWAEELLERPEVRRHPVAGGGGAKC
jgi:ketosteroid isomerase-like protein